MRLILADDHDLVRDAIAAILQNSGCSEVRTAASFPDAAKIAAQEGPFDLAILDYDMPGMNGLEGLRMMLKTVTGLPVAILSGSAKPEIAQDAIAAGAIGFLPKTMPAKSIGAAVSLMVSGAVFAPVELMRSESPPVFAALSTRESEVLRGICEGKTNKEIARDLGLQEVTVKLHVRTMTRKMNARNRTQAAMIAREMNWG
jgi:DNA-binding NarL/FixJ family response regulator